MNHPHAPSCPENHVSAPSWSTTIHFRGESLYGLPTRAVRESREGGCVGREGEPCTIAVRARGFEGVEVVGLVTVGVTVWGIPGNGCSTDIDLIPSLPYTHSPISTRGASDFFFASWFRAWLGNGFTQKRCLRFDPRCAVEHAQGFECTGPRGAIGDACGVGKVTHFSDS